MNKKIIFWLGVLVLTSAPALNCAAQEGPGPDNDELGMAEGAPGQPAKAPGMMGAMAGRPEMAGRRGPGGMGGPGFLSEDETLAVIKKNDAAFAKKVEDLRTIAPAKYKMLLRMSGNLFAMAKMEQDANLEKDAVRTLALEFDSKELSMKYDKAAEADKKAIKESLRAELSELFDLKTRGQELRVKHMEGEIARLKKNLASRKTNKAKIVEQRLDQMTGEGAGW
jgi:hypothetical protein